MSKKEALNEYEMFVSQNKNKLKEIIVWFDERLDLQLANTDSFDYARAILRFAKNKNTPSIDLRNQREKIRNDLDDMERCFVSNDSYDDEPKGFNPDGYKPNNNEQRQIAKLELKEKLKDLLLQSMLLDKQIENTNNYTRYLINIITNSIFKEILICMYINNYTIVNISNTYNYSYDTINKYKQRGIRELSKILDLIKNI